VSADAYKTHAGPWVERLKNEPPSAAKNGGEHNMVEIVSILIGVSFVLGGLVFAASYGAAYLFGKQTVSESAHYVNHRDIEKQRQSQIRDEEVTNTRASVADERPVPEIGDNTNN